MRQVPFHARSRFALLAAALGLALASAGCSTGGHPPAGNDAGPRPVAMKGGDKFFNGDIEAVLTVSRGLGHGHSGKAGRHEDEIPSLNDVFSAELNDSENKDYTSLLEKMRALEVRGSPLPPVILRLILENHGAAPVEVEILEVNSDLGNFAVRPDKLTLAPEKPTEPDPMNSLLGVTSDEIAVKVALRVGGKTESKTLLVKSVFTPDGKIK